MTLRGPQNKQQQKTKKQKTERVSVTQKSFWNNFPPPPPHEFYIMLYFRSYVKLASYG